MQKQHTFQAYSEWKSIHGHANKDVRKYTRTHEITISGKPTLTLNTHNAAVGIQEMLNPEDLLLASVSSCHLMSYLYVCSLEGIIIHQYTDHAEGIMEENTQGGGKFTSITLKPEVYVENEGMVQKAEEMHHKAHEVCFIANSLNVEVRIEPRIFIWVQTEN